MLKPEIIRISCNDKLWKMVLQGVIIRGRDIELINLDYEEAGENEWPIVRH